jgi:uncharacterized protein (TIGR03435 family)
MKLITLMFGMVVIAVGVVAAAQAPAQKPAFEVVSVKPNKSGAFQGTTVGLRGSTFSAINATVKMLIQAAYVPTGGGLIPDDRIVGGPGWIETERFDVLAKPNNDTRSIPQAQVASMVRSLLEDRFKLKAHQETRELPVYDLVVVKDRLKLKLSADQTPPTGPTATYFNTSDEPLARGFMRVSTSPSVVVLAGTAVQFSRLIPMLERPVGRKIIDKTDLKGLFDFNVRFNATETTLSPADQTATSIFTAIQELGLKLESAKAPLEVLVIDSVSRPTEN